MSQTNEPSFVAALEQAGVHEPKPLDDRPPYLLRLRLLLNGEPRAGVVCTFRTGAPAQRGKRQSADEFVLGPVTTAAGGKLELEIPASLIPQTKALPLRLEADFSQAGIPGHEWWRSRRLNARVVLWAGEYEEMPDRGVKELLCALGFRSEEGAAPLAPAIRRFANAGRTAGSPFQLGFEVSQATQKKDGLPDGMTGDQLEALRSKLVELHEREADWSQPFTAEELLCRPTQYCVAIRKKPESPPWRRVNLLLGPDIIVDGHMHINSGNCSPLPLIWDKNVLLRKTHLDRSNIDRMSYAMYLVWPLALARNLRKFAAEGSKSTVRIASDAAKGNVKAHKAALQGSEGALSPMVAMPMDMDFGHYDGYLGKQVYHERVDGKRASYRFQQWELRAPKMKQVSPVVAGYGYPAVATVPVDEPEVERLDPKSYKIDDEELTLYVPYDDQVKHTLQAAANAPWKILPFFHYDPRRWSQESGAPQTTQVFEVPERREVKVYPRAWDLPFTDHFSNGQRPFVGMKMYTALGYQPLDERLPRMANYYAKCVELDLPITCHCSAGGFYSLERPLYVLLEAKRRADDPEWLERQRSETVDLMNRRGLADLDWREYWFSENYVSPRAWRKVLEQHPSLRLCLAHFGGDVDAFTKWDRRQDPDAVRTDLASVPDEKWDELSWEEGIVNLALRYENFYTDISCVYFSAHDAYGKVLATRRFRKLLELYPALRRKIIFGSDWWMTINSGFDYPSMARKTRSSLEADTLPPAQRVDPELWEWTSCLNPIRFLRLREQAPAFGAWLKSRSEDDSGDVIDTGIHVLKSLPEEKP